MLFNKKNIKERTTKAQPVMDKMASGIARLFLAVQSGFALIMSRNINRLSKNGRRAFLGIFCALYLGGSMYIFYEAVKPTKKATPYFLPYASSGILQELGMFAKSPSMKENSLNRIQYFKTYMDSLKKSNGGRIMFDSILKARPGLMDSIYTIERLYYSPSK